MLLFVLEFKELLKSVRQLHLTALKASIQKSYPREQNADKSNWNSLHCLCARP